MTEEPRLDEPGTAIADLVAESRAGATTPSGVVVDVVHLMGTAWTAHRQVTVGGLDRGPYKPVWRMHAQTARAIIVSLLNDTVQPVQPALDGGWTMWGWELQVDDTLPVGELELAWKIQ